MKKIFNLLAMFLFVASLFIVGCDGEDGTNGVNGLTGPSGVDELVNNTCEDDDHTLWPVENPTTGDVTFVCAEVKPTP